MGGSATIFFWLQLPNVTKNYRSALAITGLVTAIATYHYVRIFNSWVGAFNVSNAATHTTYDVTLTGAPFNDAYRYVDWLLTVPLLLIELILVMKLDKDVTVSLSWKLGVSSAVMVALGYPGEIQDALLILWIFWALAMVPFTYVVFTLVAGLNDATDKQPESARSLVVAARYVTAISWLTYPFVTSSRVVVLRDPLQPHMSRLDIPLQILLPRLYSVSSFGPLLRTSLPRRRNDCLNKIHEHFPDFDFGRIADLLCFENHATK